MLLICRPGIVNEGSAVWVEMTGQSAYLCTKTFDWCDGMYELGLQRYWATLEFIIVACLLGVF
jgi:hypothetical protein